jgi:hypothetical protein
MLGTIFLRSLCTGIAAAIASVFLGFFIGLPVAAYLPASGRGRELQHFTGISSPAIVHLRDWLCFGISAFFSTFASHIAAAAQNLTLPRIPSNDRKK